MGIRPQHPSPHYGYIQRTQLLETQHDIQCFDVKCFHEKPSVTRAETYLAEGSYFWNSGMFCFKAATFLSELAQHQPDFYHKLVTLHQNRRSKDPLVSYDQDAMSQLPALSIDVALMEKSERIAMIASDIDWCDLGQFEQFQTLLPKDSDGNTKGDHIYTQDAKNNFIYSKNRCVAAVGVEDLIITDTPDAVLVSKKGCSEGIQHVVETIQEKNPKLFHESMIEYRPWGSFRVLQNEASIKVKELTVLPTKRLSLQTHKHRNEHWVVTAGIATVELDDQTLTLEIGQTCDIANGAKHRLSNNGDTPLKIIEVQFGSYLGEDDIVRLEDDFKRVSF